MLEVDTKAMGGTFRAAFLSDSQFQALKREFNMKLAFWIVGILVSTTVTAWGGKKLYRRHQEKKLLTSISNSNAVIDVS